MVAFYVGILWNFVLSFIVPYVSYFEIVDGAIDLILTAIGLKISFGWVKVPFVFLLYGLGLFCTVKIGKSLYAITEGESFLYAEWWGCICDWIWIIPWGIFIFFILPSWVFAPSLPSWVVSLYDSNAFPIIFTLWLIFGIFAEISDTSYKLSDAGDIFFYGEGVPECDELAVHYYEKDSKSDWAQLQLGWCYEHGKGVATDWRKAAEYYQLSADAGRARSQNNLGICYENGQGVRQSYDLAAYYYMKAAKQGDMYAQWNIGRMYENGTGVDKSLLEAFNWYRKAADQGHDAAKKRLREIEQKIQKY